MDSQHGDLAVNASLELFEIVEIQVAEMAAVEAMLEGVAVAWLAAAAAFAGNHCMVP
jgi:hypothetical protein